MNTRTMLAAAGAALLAGCAAQGPTPARTMDDGLADSSWRLQEIQSMSDDQGTTRPGPDRSYTLRFGADGRAAFRLDCNRGMASYTATPSEPGRGGLGFGNLGMTRAMCPPGSLDTRIARDMPWVRSYRVQGGQLSMSLMADGGVYIWTREEAPPR